jgi:tetratricopeptide (TPR) repeat protein
MKTFSTAEIARILDVTPAWIRGQAHRSLIVPERTRQGHFRYSFQDLVLLRTARGLRNPGVSPRRIHYTLRSLLDALPPGRSLSSLKIRLDGRAIVAGDNNTVWEPESGQTSFVFVPSSAARPPSEPESSVARLPHRELSAAEWFDVALKHEERDRAYQAEEAYRRTCRIDPGHVNARINLGRLLHARRALAEAEALYRDALAIDPRHPIALFNLGVVLEDTGATESAMDCYTLAIESDADVAEAHYNLARLYARHSEHRAAMQHYARYKALTQEEDS